MKCKDVNKHYHSEDISQKRCLPCEGGVAPLTKAEVEKFIQQIENWEVVEYKKIQKVFECKNFKEALRFINNVGDIAEDQGHHPDIELFNWNKVKIVLCTHAIQGLHENDFILAAKIDAAYKQICRASRL